MLHVVVTIYSGKIGAPAAGVRSGRRPSSNELTGYGEESVTVCTKTLGLERQRLQTQYHMQVPYHLQEARMSSATNRETK